MADYFDILQLPVSCDIDIRALEQQYRELQSQWHPDRFAGADKQQKLAAIQKTSLLNDAYSTLKSPIGRAAHLLALHGIDVEQHSQSHMAPEFLLTQMELREALEAKLQAGDIDALDTMKQDVAGQKAACWEDFREEVGRQDYEAARRTFYRMQFMYKLFDEINDAEEKLLGY